MRREVVRVALLSASIALAVLVVPLGVAILLLAQFDQNAELERAALRAAVQVDPGFDSGDPVELPPIESGTRLGLYDTTGTLRSGDGPGQADPAVRQALTGEVGQVRQDGALVVAVPIAAGERVTGVIRAAAPSSTIWVRTAVGWGILAALAGAAMLAAVTVARRRARRLAGPLETLAVASQAVGDGDFAVRVEACGIAEIDAVSATQNATAYRLGSLIERERQFSANASHQLRTPLAGLQLGLEAALQTAGDHQPAALLEALATTRRLQATIDDVLALHRRTADDVLAPDGDGPPSTHAVPPDRLLPLADLLEAVATRWHRQFAAHGRQLEHHGCADLPGRPLPAVRVGQILDVLLDNSLRHGAGRVVLRARPTGEAVAIDVMDEGPGIRDPLGDVFARGTGSGHGIGLGLAREFAASLGGRLVLTSRTPPVFTVYLPVAPTAR